MYRSRGKMDRHEESQDVDITILPDNEQPQIAVDGGDTLPHFQFFDGGGALQNSTDRPVEGFVALKITYEHVFRKQREQTRLLQQKNQQLVAEIQQLKKGSGGSVSHVHVKAEQDPYGACEVTSSSSEGIQHLPVETQPINKYQSVDTKDLDLQLASLDVNKAKLRSGLVRLAKCLLKKESENKTFCNLLRKILENLQGSQCDSDESLRELCSLVEEMSDLEDSVDRKNGQGPGSKDASMSVNSPLPSDISLQKIVTNYQQMDLQRCLASGCESQEGLSTQDQLSQVKSQMKTEKSQDEDMYGPEGTLGNTDYVPYNLTRLHMKLKKLQQFPAKYESMVQHMNASYLEKQRLSTCTCNSWNGNFLSSPRNPAMDTKPVPSSSGLSPEEMTSFLGIQHIKLPPTDPTKQAVLHVGNFTDQRAMYPVSPATTTLHQEKMTEGSKQSLDARCTSPRKSITTSLYETQSRGMSAYQSSQVPIARKFSDQGAYYTNYTNAKQVNSGASKENLTFAQACEPPSEPNVIALGANEVPEWHSGMSHNAVSSKHCAPLVISTNEKKQAHGKHVHVYNPSVDSGIIGRKERVPDLQTQVPKNVFAAPLVKTDITDPKSSEWTLVTECPQGPYMPGSESVHDQLVTAHSSMQYVPGHNTQMECPVCLQKFPPDTSEETMTSHVNLHFDGTLLKNDTYSFEILDQ